MNKTNVCVVCDEACEENTYHTFDCEHTIHMMCLNNEVGYSYDINSNMVKCKKCNYSICRVVKKLFTCCG